MASLQPAAQRDQLAATREILRAISSMPMQTEALCELILRNALRLVGCQFGAVALYEGGRQFCFVAASGIDQIFLQRWLHHRYLVPKEVFHEHGPWRPLQLSYSEVGALLAPADPIFDACHGLMAQGYSLFIPLASGKQLLGSFTIFRKENQPFVDEEIDLVHAFADHAVAALENARTLAALERQNALQSANAEILRAIGRTPDQPEVICALILDRAMALAGTRIGHMLLYEGQRRFRTIAVTGSPSEDEAFWRGRDYHAKDTMFREEGPWRPLHVPDIDAVSGQVRDDPVLLSTYQRAGIKAFLYIPLVAGARIVGAFGVAKT